MVVGAFPVAKLGVLLVKQISKPIANLLKARAKNSPFFRVYVCMPPAQLYNWLEIKTKMWTMNLGRPVNVPVLSEAMAIDLGANLLGEFIIFFIGAGVLVLEVARQSNNETIKQENAKQEKLELISTLNDLAFRAERQDTQIQELTRIVAELDSSKWKKLLGGKKSALATLEEDAKNGNLPEGKIQRNSDNVQDVTHNDSSNSVNSDNPKGIINKALHWLMVEDRNETKKIIKLTK